MTMLPVKSDRLPVLLPFRLQRQPGDLRLGAVPRAFLYLSLLLFASTALAQGGKATLSAMQVIAKWTPLLLTGFGFNILISALAMVLGTIAGLGLGLGLLSETPRDPANQLGGNADLPERAMARAVVLCDVPGAVPGHGVRPAYSLSRLGQGDGGVCLPVMANVAEVVRGAVRSVPSTQWEAAEALAFNRRQIMWRIILPQCIKRMLPPWMNIYCIVAMSTVLASIVGVSEMLTLTAQVHAAEGGRPELFAPLYGFALLCFFLYCYPINLWTARLERRFQTG